jgi:hypothetical protein
VVLLRQRRVFGFDVGDGEAVVGDGEAVVGDGLGEIGIDTVLD